MRRPAPTPGPSAWILTRNHDIPVRVWGLQTTERLRRAARAAGVPGDDIGVGPEANIGPRERACALFRSDYVFDQRLVQAMIAAENTVLSVPTAGADGGRTVAAHVDAARLPQALALLRNGDGASTRPADSDLRFVEPAELAGAYSPALRRVEAPYLVRARPENVQALETQMFAASYKGVTDLVTKWLWPGPARWVTHHLASRGVRPNAVTLVSWILVAMATACFAYGWFGTGLVLGWIMTFLDTVDGKLARVTLTSSRVGDVLDHGLDLVHPPLWYVAWAMGLPVQAPFVWPALVVTLVGYVVGRMIEGIFLLVFKTEIHTWRPIDSGFRTVTARRNPNLILLTLGVLMGRPDVGLLLVGVWTAVSIVFHLVRLGQAVSERAQGHRVESWLHGV
jgi:phosphatidylglycerophosphate synthase